MFKIHFNHLLRIFSKNKLLNAINILGLAFGLCSFLLIVLYADHELSYDEFHPNKNNLYRIEGRTNNPTWFSNLGMEHGKELTSGKYPSIVDIVQLNNANRTFIEVNEKRFLEERIIQVGPGSKFFDFFGYDWLSGNKATALKDPNSVVITQSLASKYFKGQSAVGETLKMGDNILTISGTIRDIPSNSHIQFDMVYTNAQLFGSEHFHTNTYVLLADGSEPKQVERDLLAMEGVAVKEFHELSEVKLVALPDIYYESVAGFGNGGRGDIFQLYVFLIIGSFILIISLANYVNISLARYNNRKKDVGINKVLGASGSGLTTSFFIENLMMTLLSIPIIIVLLAFALPKLNEFLELQIQNKFFYSPQYWLWAFISLIVLSFFITIFPAIKLANSATLSLIRDNSTVISGGIKVRSALIFAQLILLFTLGISGWFMNRQLNYLSTKDMGFDPTRVIKISNAYEFNSMQEYQLFEQQLMRSPHIQNVAFGPMMGDGMQPLAYRPEGHNENYENLLSYGVEIDYFDVLGIDILAGEFKNKLVSADSGEIISLVNESFIKQYEWEDAPIGKKIVLRPGTENELHRTVSAVFNDFHFYSLKEQITPQIISLRNDPRFVNTNILIKSATDDIPQTLQAIQTSWTEILPETPVQYEFMADSMKALYKKESQTGTITILFSMLAILLSISGLTVFMAFVISTRSKEMAIRKVLGASLIQIVGALNRKFALSILIAALTGSLLSYLLVDIWLQDYAYAIELSPITFALAALMVYALVFIITSVQSMKSSLANPVVALKSE